MLGCYISFKKIVQNKDATYLNPVLERYFLFFWVAVNTGMLVVLLVFKKKTYVNSIRSFTTIPFCEL